MIREDRLIDLFKQLCLINSPALGEGDVVAFVRKHLEGLGLEVFEDDAAQKIGGNANNLIAWKRGALTEAPKIFFSAHFDTVEPTTGLIIEERDGVFYSASDTILGADDKAGMAPAIEAVHALIESGEPHGDVCLLFSCAEEIGLKGAFALDIEKLGLDFGYVLDTGPPVGSYVTQTGTHDRLEIEVFGVPAHSGKDPEKGINAIQVAAAAISQMKSGRISPNTTANLGTISGGSAVNIVCPSVTIRAEARSTVLAELEAQVDHMIQCFEKAASDWGTHVKIAHRRHYDAYQIEESTQVAQVAIAASKSLGLEPALRMTLGGSDANVYNKKGVPCVVVATGMEKIHTHDEFVSRKDLVATAELSYRIVLEAAKVRRPS